MHIKNGVAEQNKIVQISRTLPQSSNGVQCFPPNVQPHLPTDQFMLFKKHYLCTVCNAIYCIQWWWSLAKPTLKLFSSSQIYLTVPGFELMKISIGYLGIQLFLSLNFDRKRDISPQTVKHHIALVHHSTHAPIWKDWTVGKSFLECCLWSHLQAEWPWVRRLSWIGCKS